MNNIIQSKSLVSIILSIVILIVSVPLSAAASIPTPDPAPITPIYPTSTDHIKTINQFISEISQIQQQVFDIASLLKLILLNLTKDFQVVSVLLITT